MKPLSQRAYARHRRAAGLAGGTHRAVREAIAAGRLATSLTPDKTAIADPDLADREWLANTRADKIPLTGPAAANPPPPAAAECPASLNAGQMPYPPLAESRARREAALAEMAERELGVHKGRFVDVAEVRADVIAAYTVVRTQLLGVPSRLRQRDATFTASQLALVDDLIRDALEELADADAAAAAEVS